MVAVDAGVTAEGAYILSNNQEEYAYLGARWLFEQLGGQGDVVYMRGIAGVSADTDRDNGFKRALAEFPGIEIVHEVFTGWQQDQGKQQMFDFLATGIPFDGVWTSGIDNVIVDAFIESGAPLVPIVGADNAGFVGQLNSVEGLEGAAVTNPGSVGGAGIALAVDILNGEAPDDNTVLGPEIRSCGRTSPRKAAPRYEAAQKFPTSIPSGRSPSPFRAGRITPWSRSSPVRRTGRRLIGILPAAPVPVDGAGAAPFRAGRQTGSDRMTSQTDPMSSGVYGHAFWMRKTWPRALAPCAR